MSLAVNDPERSDLVPLEDAPELVAQMFRDLGRQLAALRHEARLTQHGLAALIGYSRSAVSLAEIGRDCQAPEFWQACDKALDTGGALAAAWDRIEQFRSDLDHAAAIASSGGPRGAGPGRDGHGRRAAPERRGSRGAALPALRR
jgi:DNA-binding XRE family transcriptional regulator